MSGSGIKPKKIVITPEEVALSTTRKPLNQPRNVKNANSQPQQVMEVNPQILEDGVTFIQVNDLGEVSAIDGSLLGQDIAIQITGDDPETGANAENAIDETNGILS